MTFSTYELPSMAARLRRIADNAREAAANAGPDRPEGFSKDPALFAQLVQHGNDMERLAQHLTDLHARETEVRHGRD